MRLKLYPISLPGYYALPAQYVNDLVANQVGGYLVFSGVDYAGYAARYQAFRSRYQIVKAPFACDTKIGGDFRESDSARRKMREYARNREVLADREASDREKKMAGFKLYQAAWLESGDRNEYGSDAAFQYARLSRHVGRGIDRVDEFYSGKFKSYYCWRKDGFSGKELEAGDIWPAASHYATREFRAALDGLSSSAMPYLGWQRFLQVASDQKAYED
jgi:hypothetical protein